MLLCIAGILSPELLAQTRSLLREQPFNDGQATAGWAARLVKNNRQLDRAASHYGRLQALVAAALAANEVFALAAMPKTMRPLLFARYEVGMSYGDHVDNAIMGDEPARMRSDVSFTVFLSEPEEYSGGELIIEDTSGSQSFKLAAGSVVLYPSTAVHRVETITAGERLVAVGWVQSLIRDPARRQIVFDLETLKRESFEKHGKTTQFDTLSKCASNLWRMWAEL